MGYSRYIGERLFRSFFWRVIRPLSPVYRYCRYNDVLVNRAIKQCHRPFEPGSAYRPAMLSDVPNYEETLCRGLSQVVQEGDRVVIVGGGLGVTTIHAARRARSEGRVTVYEASGERMEDLRWAIQENGQVGTVTPVHGLVGNEVKAYGDTAAAKVIPAEELAECDVLELDCEGAEIDILREMNIRPRAVCVETHGFRGADTETVHQKLQKLGYAVEDLGVAEPRERRFCGQNDIRVLKGQLR